MTLGHVWSSVTPTGRFGPLPEITTSGISPLFCSCYSTTSSQPKNRNWYIIALFQRHFTWLLGDRILSNVFVDDDDFIDTRIVDEKIRDSSLEFGSKMKKKLPYFRPHLSSHTLFASFVKGWLTKSSKAEKLFLSRWYSLCHCIYATGPDTETPTKMGI